MAEEGSGCLVRRLPWVTILRVAFLLILIGMVIYCFVCNQRLAQQQQLESSGVSRERRKRDAHLPPATCWWSLGTSGWGLALPGRGGEGSSREENRVEAEG